MATNNKKWYSVIAPPAMKVTATLNSRAASAIRMLLPLRTAILSRNLVRFEDSCDVNKIGFIPGSCYGFVMPGTLDCFARLRQVLRNLTDEKVAARAPRYPSGL